MAQTFAEEIVGRYLDHLIRLGTVQSDAFAVLFGSWLEKDLGKDDPIEVIVVCDSFDKDLVAEGRDLIAATWDVDTRIEPFPASRYEWENFSESPKLDRAKAEGKIITVS